MSCPVEADPDIAGRGVRTAVYTQALLCMVPSVLLVLAGPNIDEAYASVGRKMYSQGRITVTTLIVTNGALLIAAFVKISKGTLTLYHATIVLCLSWIVYLGALSSAVTLSFVHPLRHEPKFTLWLRILVSPIRPMSSVSLEQTATLTVRQFRKKNGTSVSAAVVHSEYHLIYLCLHLLGIGILGVMLFSEPGNLSPSLDCNADVVLWTFNERFRLTGPRFQQFWFGVYVVAIIPGVSLFLSAIVVVLVLASPWWALYSLARWTIPSIRQFAFATRLGFVLPFLAIIPLLIACTELTIAANISANAVSAGENAWGFGQILALVLLVGPAFETGKAIHVIFSPRAVAFPQLPAREAERAADRDVHAERARTLARDRRREWLGKIGHVNSVVTGGLVHLTSGDDGTLGTPVTVGEIDIPDATTDDVFAVIVTNGMRKEWDSDLDYDGVLKRYDPGTALRYAVMRSRHTANGPEIGARDYVVVQRVERRAERNQEITVTYASVLQPLTDGLAKQPGVVRGTLQFEGWLIEPDPPNVRLRCVSHVVLEDTLPLAAARDIVLHSLSHPGKVRWALRHYGFAPVWDAPDPADGGILEVERMDTDTGTYIATFRSKAEASVTVVCDTLERMLYKKGAHVSWEVINGSQKHLTVEKEPAVAAAGPLWEVIRGSKTHLKDSGDGKKTLRFTFAAPDMLLELTVVRRIKVSVPAEQNDV